VESAGAYKEDHLSPGFVFLKCGNRKIAQQNKSYFWDIRWLLKNLKEYDLRYLSNMKKVSFQRTFFEVIFNSFITIFEKSKIA
jgi:hypothetical protein